MKLKMLGLAFAAIALSANATAHAQSPPGPPPGFYIKPVASRETADALALYAGVAPGSEGVVVQEQWNDLMGQVIVRNVTRPTLTPYLPAKGKATGAAVIVAPGGAYVMLSMQNEGVPVAQWLADHGVAAFVLKYRTDLTPAEDQGFVEVMGARFGAAAKAGAGRAPPISQPLAVADGAQALRLVRQNAARWGVDPHRVGLLGFSAGAMTALQVTLNDAPDARPDFVGLIYGPMNAVSPPPTPPPLFVALAADDSLFGGAGSAIIDSWQAAKAPVEFHLYEKGGHGFGMLGPQGTSKHWIDEFYWWLEGRGLLQPGGKTP